MEDSGFPVEVCVGQVTGSGVEVSVGIRDEQQGPVSEGVLFIPSIGADLGNNIPKGDIFGIEHLSLAAHCLRPGSGILIHRHTSAGEADHKLVFAPQANTAVVRLAVGAHRALRPIFVVGVELWLCGQLRESGQFNVGTKELHEKGPRPVYPFFPAYALPWFSSSLRRYNRLISSTLYQKQSSRRASCSAFSSSLSAPKP